jgi:hypothetical protein
MRSVSRSRSSSEPMLRPRLGGGAATTKTHLRRRAGTGMSDAELEQLWSAFGRSRSQRCCYPSRRHGEPVRFAAAAEPRSLGPARDGR